MKLKHKRSPCSIAGTLDFLGDKWTLILIRDLLGGKKRYNEFLASPEKIPTNILASRLKMMEEAGIVNKQRYSAHLRRFEYILTERGRDLWPVLQEIARWGKKHIDDTWDGPDWFWAGDKEKLKN